MPLITTDTVVGTGLGSSTEKPSAELSQITISLLAVSEVLNENLMSFTFRLSAVTALPGAL